MDDKYKKLLQQEKRQHDELKNEQHFEASSFAEELLPLLGEYFIGNFTLKDNAIICDFENGQTIKLTAAEVKNAD